MAGFTNVLGEVLRGARRSRGLTLREVERMARGFTASSLGSYERGERAISLERFFELARVYGIPADRLLGRVLDRLAPDSRTEVVIDLNRLGMIPGHEPRRVTDMIRRVGRQRGQPLSDVISLRAGDLEALALDSGVDPETLRRRLGPAVRRPDEDAGEANRAT
jgi:transcriptional regulator with XRE-family HTH domain